MGVEYGRDGNRKRVRVMYIEPAAIITGIKIPAC